MLKQFSFFFLIAFLLFILNSFTVTPPAVTDLVLSAISEEFHQNLSEIEKKIADYQQIAKAYQTGSADLSSLKTAHLNTRLAVKKAEFFLEYYDREGMKTYINGAPLPTIEKHVPEIRILEPGGLQVLDELVFGESPEAENEVILQHLHDLQVAFSRIKAYQQLIPIQHRHIFEAGRQEIIRIFTLGLTGFDTPGSVNAIPEAKAALSALRWAFQQYRPAIEKKDQMLADQLFKRFSEGILYLTENDNFEQFDRLTFFKNYLNPLDVNILNAQHLLSVEFAEETSSAPVAVNDQAMNLFSEDFLNAGFYANLDREALNEKRVALGKLLFFDPILSANNERSCASCHQPERGFTDGLTKSMAINGQGHISRNAPTLLNAVYSERYFYDLREESLERQIKHVVLDSLEFATDFFEIVEKLSQSQAYRDLFAEAYPDQTQYQLSKWSVSNALACYVVSLRSFNSPFDQYVTGKREELSEDVRRGFNLFMGKAACGTCHFAPVFNGSVPPIYEESESEVLGVPATTDTINPQIDSDLGRIISYRPEDQAYFYAYSFKTPTVRNVALTAPYMHNGVYQTLEEVVDFYNKGGGLGMGLNLPHQTLPDTPLGLNTTEISDLVAFMNSLTDTTGLTSVPVMLPLFENQPKWNERKIGGSY